MTLQKPRENAARILLSHAAGGGFLEDRVDRELGRIRLKGPDRALVQELCYGCLRWRSTLDWLIRRHTREVPTPPAQVLLEIGLYQLFWLDRVPSHAAVHETVEAAHALDLGPQSGFINAILRRYLREAEETRLRLTELKSKDPAIGWSQPRWLVDRWRQQLGEEACQAFLAWNNSPAPVFARINTLKSDAGRVIEAWRLEGVDYDFARYDWAGENLVFRLRRHPPLERLKSFGEGWFYVQDPSTLMPVALLAPRPGERILDLCAAPGGKASYIAQCVDNDGAIIAAEPDARRRLRLQQNCDRLAADVRVVTPDDPLTEGPFDAILVDAPCSNTGVLRRRLDARWRLTAAELKRCRTLQDDLLRRAVSRLKPGGRLVYSTCSVEPEENEGCVQALLATAPSLRLEAERHLHPVRDQVDGAYAARLCLPVPQGAINHGPSRAGSASVPSSKAPAPPAAHSVAEDRPR